MFGVRTEYNNKEAAPCNVLDRDYKVVVISAGTSRMPRSSSKALKPLIVTFVETFFIVIPKPPKLEALHTKTFITYDVVAAKLFLEDILCDCSDLSAEEHARSFQASIATFRDVQS